MLRRVAAALACSAALGAQPAMEPSDVAHLTTGASAATYTFLPHGGGALEPLAEPGKPTVVIVFASWCSGCVAEMPRNLQNYARYKDRVAFRGVDYYDSADGADALQAKYALPFPVERVTIDKSAPPPVAAPVPGETPPAVVFHGITPKTLPLVLPSISSQLPKDLAAKLADVAKQCAGLSESDCIAYAKTQGVGLDDSAHVVAPPSPGPAPKADAASKSFTMPVTFVIDANGIVTDAIVGYSAELDPLPAALAKLGIK